MTDSVVNLRVTRRQALVLRTTVEERLARLDAEARVSSSARTEMAYDRSTLRDVRDSLKLLLVQQEGPR